MPNVKGTTVSNQWVKEMVFTHKGDTMEGHKHIFDHNTLLSVGDFEVTVEGEVYKYTAPVVLVILKDKEHSIKCVSDYGLGYCLHILRNGDGVDDIVDPANIPGLGASLQKPLIHEV